MREERVEAGDGVEEPVRPVKMEPDPMHPRAAPVHPLSALLLVTVDNLWTFADWAVMGWWLTVPLCFLTVFLPSVVIQRHLKRDRWGRAVVLATLLGGLAAVPTPIFGTPVGLALLAWTGVDRLLGRPIKPSKP
jgi:hypothetical protein